MAKDKEGHGSEKRAVHGKYSTGTQYHGGKKLSVPDQHMVRIAKDTVKNPMKALLGGPSVEQAKSTLKRFGIKH